MKKKTIYIIIAIAVVAILVIGLQIYPKTLAFDFEANPIDTVITTYAADPDNPHIRTVYHPNQAQIDELKSRLESLSGVENTREFNHTTTMASIEIDLENKDSMAVQSKIDGTLQLICPPSAKIMQIKRDGILVLGNEKTKVYRIDNEEFHRYVINLCSGGDRVSAIKVE